MDFFFLNALTWRRNVGQRVEIIWWNTSINWAQTVTFFEVFFKLERQWKRNSVQMCSRFTPQQFLFFLPNKASPLGQMFSGLVAQSLTSRRSETHNCNGLSNLAYFLLVVTFPGGQKKTNKEWRSCFSSRRLPRVPVWRLAWCRSSAHTEQQRWGWVWVTGSLVCSAVAQTTAPLGRHCCVFSPLWIQDSFLSLTYTASLSSNTVQLVPTSYAHSHDIAAMSRCSRCSRCSTA